MSGSDLRADLPELRELEGLIHRHESRIRADILGQIRHRRQRLPLYVVELGNPDPAVPAVGFFGGVHGNERIGTRVVLAFMHSLLEQLRWDEGLRTQLERVRLVFMPLVNPSGMLRNQRATASGVDLMRNAPVDAASAHWLVGGQRLSSRLPWYRGRAGQMEVESEALCEVVTQRLMRHPFAISLDCHSGFGMTNRIWFPYAHKPEPIAHLAEVFALRALFRSAYPHHRMYRIEPQAQNYMTHGDLWDHLYDLSLGVDDRVYLPLTLEMGSWLWVRKNPLQMFRAAGLFNPHKRHRRHRILRQHLVWFDFLVRAAASWRNWLPYTAQRREELDGLGRIHWPQYRAAETATATTMKPIDGTDSEAVG